MVCASTFGGRYTYAHRASATLSEMMCVTVWQPVRPSLPLPRGQLPCMYSTGSTMVTKKHSWTGFPHQTKQQKNFTLLQSNDPLIAPKENVNHLLHKSQVHSVQFMLSAPTHVSHWLISRSMTDALVCSSMGLRRMGPHLTPSLWPPGCLIPARTMPCGWDSAPMVNMPAC